MAAFAAVLAAGCQNSATRPASSNAIAAPTVTAPTVTAPTVTAPAVVTQKAVSPAVSIRTPLHDQPSFALARVVSGIRRGTAVATLPQRFGGLCNASYDRKSTLDWASGTREFGSWRSEFGQIFFEALREGGVNVVGDPQDLFGQKKNAQSAEFLIGARIRKLTGKFCEKHRWLDRSPTGKFNGEFTIGVEWSVYSTLSKQTVARFNTQGYFRQRKAKIDGIAITLLGAFAAATEDVLKTRQFVDLIERRSESASVPTRAVSSTKTMPEDVGEFTPIEIAQTRQSKLPIRRIVDDVTAAVVSIRAGGGHGSGFLVDRSGLLLTNEHVVGTAKRVQVVFLNGLEVAGTVLRRNSARDVALVRIPIRARSILSMRTNPVRRLEDVYAVGSPIFEDLAGTVTRGVVSALRVDTRGGINFIQADVPISSGNSGGPLLDQFGNVVGITVATLRDKRARNVNWFIPINDALEALNIVHSNARTSGR